MSPSSTRPGAARLVDAHRAESDEETTQTGGADDDDNASASALVSVR